MAVPSQKDLIEKEELEIESVQQAKPKEVTYISVENNKTDSC